MKYRQKPVVVEAVRVTWANWSDLCDLFQKSRQVVNSDSVDVCNDACSEQAPFIRVAIRYNSETIHAYHGDFIVLTDEGDLFPRSSKGFLEFYEPVVQAGDTCVHGVPWNDCPDCRH